MKKYHYRFFLFTFLFTFCVVVNTVAQESTDNEQSGEESEEYLYSPVSPREVAKKTGYETDPIDVKKFDDKLWREVIGETDYSETPSSRKKKNKKDSAAAGTSGGKRSAGSMNEDSDDYESSSSGSKPISSPIITLIVYGIAIAIIGYLIYFIVKNVVSARSAEKQAMNQAKATQPAVIEDIKELEIDRLLAEALASGNYRLAVRIYFLGLLQKLDEDGLITWKKDKTNNDYLAELYLKTPHLEDIKNLTVAYEQVWYGDHDLSATTYEKIISLFNGLIQKLKVQKAE